jgi:PAS domain-containing protein
LPAENTATAPERRLLRVRFSEIRVGNTAVDPAAASIIEDKPQAFEAKFSALLLAHGSEVRCRYRILGLDDRWQETARADARLDFARPGRYQLEVQARRDGQPWSEPAAALALEVRARWYETSVFRGMLVALICIALGFLGRLYRNTAAAREALRRKVERRTAELIESEERFRNMADTAPVLIWVSGPDRHFTFFNRRWMDFIGSSNDQDLRTSWPRVFIPPIWTGASPAMILLLQPAGAFRPNSGGADSTTSIDGCCAAAFPASRPPEILQAISDRK